MGRYVGFAPSRRTGNSVTASDCAPILGSFLGVDTHLLDRLRHHLFMTRGKVL